MVKFIRLLSSNSGGKASMLIVDSSCKELNDHSLSVSK